jgi:transcriptional regulator with XRE-family HTH domain
MDEPAPEVRAEVARVVRRRMAQLGFSLAELRRRSGLAPNTLHGITEGMSGDRNKSTWVALAAGLNWPWDYFLNILNGRADKNVTAESPLEARLAKLADGLAEIGALRQEVTGLKDIFHVVDKKIDIVLGSRLTSDDASQSD